MVHFYCLFPKIKRLSQHNRWKNGGGDGGGRGKKKKKRIIPKKPFLISKVGCQEVQ